MRGSKAKRMRAAAEYAAGKGDEGISDRLYNRERNGVVMNQDGAFRRHLRALKLAMTHDLSLNGARWTKRGVVPANRYEGIQSLQSPLLAQVYFAGIRA